MSIGRRVALLAAIVAVMVALVSYVIVTDIDRRNTARPPGTTVAPPPVTTRDLPTSGTSTPTVPFGPQTGSSVAIEVEKFVRSETGWTHKAWCEPSGEVAIWTVLECVAETEPPIREQAPSRVLAVVVDEQGRVVLTRGREGPYTRDALRAEAGLSCDDLRSRGFPYVAALAYWLVWDRPAPLVEEPGALACTSTYGEAATEALDSAVPRY